MRVLMVAYEHAFRELSKKNGKDNSLEDFSDQFRRMAARGASSVVLTIINGIPKTFESVDFTGDVDE